MLASYFILSASYLTLFSTFSSKIFLKICLKEVSSIYFPKLFLYRESNMLGGATNKKSSGNWTGYLATEHSKTSTS